MFVCDLPYYIDKNNYKFPDLVGKYSYVAEHLFKIIKIIKPRKFVVEPIFINNNVIAKRVNKKINNPITIPTKLISRCELLDQKYFWTDINHMIFLKIIFPNTVIFAIINTRNL